MGITRREALKIGVFGTGAMVLPAGRLFSASSVNRLAESLLPQPFSVPLAVPAVLSPVRSTATTDYYQITMRAQAIEILPGFQTVIFGYEGAFPGPTIEVQQGRPVVVRFINTLPAKHPTFGYRPDTSVHLHGSASLPQFDGYANDLTRPNQYKDYQYPNHQENRSLWYHDHAAHFTAQNVYSGLAGMYLIHDAIENALPIPRGRYDVPLVIRDALFDNSGQLLWVEDQREGINGDVILVNGRPWPVMAVERRKYRFRMLNASASRDYRFQLDSGEPFIVIGTDAGLMPHPQVVNNFRHDARRTGWLAPRKKRGRRRPTRPRWDVRTTSGAEVVVVEHVADAPNVAVADPANQARVPPSSRTPCARRCCGGSSTRPVITNPLMRPARRGCDSGGARPGRCFALTTDSQVLVSQS